MPLHNDVGKGQSKVGGGGVSWDLVEGIEEASVSQRQRAGLDASRGTQKRGLQERLAQAASNKAMRGNIKAARQARRRGGSYVKPMSG